MESSIFNVFDVMEVDSTHSRISETMFMVGRDFSCAKKCKIFNGFESHFSAILFPWGDKWEIS